MRTIVDYFRTILGYIYINDLLLIKPNPKRYITYTYSYTECVMLHSKATQEFVVLYLLI
jgi:hypothetical protein